ncbi:NAD(P)H-binding protein [Paraferrimonas haliotis]|uniref:NAD(P)H-binding protein n=1 Tax=Paraferrimonas haliotis TaxID=2013866 RepID=UPI000BA9551E|nr:NAD(P)H-binding protein [Paraferrimonas haliotis]
MNQTISVCVLGATGTIGIALTSHLIAKGVKVNAVVKDANKLNRLLLQRNIDNTNECLTVYTMDLFAGNGELANGLAKPLDGCCAVFNCASPKLSWKPWSKINRTWQHPITSLTKTLVALGSEQVLKPHIVSFCGPDYFDGYNTNLYFYQRWFSKTSRVLFPALQDNYDEALFLSNACYPNWTVFRCGGIKPDDAKQGTISLGKASNVAIDFVQDKSNYRAGKGYSLYAHDLGAYIAELMATKSMASVSQKMPYAFNLMF